MTRKRILIKICGVTQPDQAQDCERAGADWLGLNFHPASPRSVSVQKASEIRQALAESTRAIGVFVDRPPGEIRTIATQVGLWGIQLHGSESPESLVELTGFRLIKAFRLREPSDADRIREYLQAVRSIGVSLEGVLVDAFDPRLAGGTGQTIPQALLGGLFTLPRLILAGGLTPANVEQMAVHVRPWMVDVASGVESKPGIKDPARVAEFIAAVRRAENEIERRDTASGANPNR